MVQDFSVSTALKAAGVALVLVFAGAAVSGCSFSVGGGLAQCDNPELQTAIKDALRTQANITVTSTSNIRSAGPRSATADTCNMHAVFADGREVDYTYTLSAAEGRTNFRITAATVTNAPAGGSATNSAAPSAADEGATNDAAAEGEAAPEGEAAENAAEAPAETPAE